MIGEQARQRAQYKKGVLLGLTVAEAMLLILFALMLALGAVMAKKDHNLASLGARLVEATRQLREAQTRVDVLQDLAAGRASDDFIREVVLARQRQAALDRQSTDLAEREKRLRKDTQLAKALEGVDDPKARTRELAALGARLEDETRKISPQTDTKALYDLVPNALALAEAADKAKAEPEGAKVMLGGAERVARENATLRGQVNRYRKELAKIGKGGEYPPCWVTEAGDIEYLFDIELLSDGSMRVRDVAPPARALDRRELPISSELFAGAVSRQRFIALTEPLFTLANKRECRFVVVARDHTQASQKDLFKTLLLTVEGHFYKSLRR
jgi:hypothetical protein